MSLAYSNLKNANKADEGRRLYAEGKTITANRQKRTMTAGAIAIGGEVATRMIYSSAGNTRIGQINPNYVRGGLAVVNLALQTKLENENKKLRAYYARTNYKG